MKTVADGTTKTAVSYDALEERVTNQGSMIRQLGEEMAVSIREIRTETSRLFGELSTQIKANSTDASTAYKSLEAKFDTNAKAAADAGRPQYLALFMAMIATIGITVTIIQWQTGLHDKPVDDKITTLTSLISDLAKSTTQGFADLGKATVSRSEYELTNSFERQLADLRTQQRDQIRLDLNNRVDRLADFTRAQLEKQVPRDEHQFHWDAEAKIDDHLEGEIRALGMRLDNLSPTSDIIKTLTDRVHELELRTLGAKPAAAG